MEPRSPTLQVILYHLSHQGSQYLSPNARPCARIFSAEHCGEEEYYDAFSEYFSQEPRHAQVLPYQSPLLEYYSPTVLINCQILTEKRIVVCLY